jgi:DNA mismatch repair protein MutH
MITYDFDPANIDSIKEQAEKVLHNSLRKVLAPEQLSEIEQTLNRNRKGHFGDIVEKYVFNKEPDNAPEPDFPEAHLELKTTGIVPHKKTGYSAKERLVLGMIDFDKIIDENWANSSFLKKNSNLLILFYLFKKELPILDYEFKLIQLLNLLNGLSSADALQIKEDWENIAAKVRQGKAHELSEGDTFYLGACTKGATGAKRRSQPNSPEKAKPRAFSLKQNYLSALVAKNSGLIDKDQEEMISENDPKSIEAFVHAKLDKFVGLTTDEIQEKLGVYLGKASKAHCFDLSCAMLGTKKKKIAEFEKANVKMKTIRLERSGTLKESMSFPAMDYMTIVEEAWAESTFRDLISSNKYLFMVFQFDKNNVLRFKKYMFWNIPYADLEKHVRKVWEDTVDLIRHCQADALPGITDDPVCHVRPHGQTSRDIAPTPCGTFVTKQSFWLNAAYIREQITKP